MFKLGRFELGRVEVTIGIVDQIHEDDQVMALRKHHMGDWGTASEQDQLANNKALENGGRLFSQYKSSHGILFWIITEEDRSKTTLLLPEEERRLYFGARDK